MPEPDRGAVRAFAEEFERATGLPVQPDPFCFGDSAEMADELAALVMNGRKRATAAMVVEYEHDGEPVPRVGQHWVVHDGAGQPVCVIRDDEIVVGRLTDVLDPAFAWDEGEGDRTYEDWLEGHTRYWSRSLPRIGAEFSLDLPVVLERFSVVWPEVHATPRLAGTDELWVRPAWAADRDWLEQTMRERWRGAVVSRGHQHVPARLPALLAVERDGRRVGVLTFRPRPGGETEVVTIDALERGRGIGALLLEAVTAVAGSEAWRRLWMITTNDNTIALRSYQRAGWDLVALHRDALEASRRLLPSIPTTGVDGIPIRHELELELLLSDPPAERETIPRDR
jgi:uncharacterized protein YhfF